MNTPIPNPLEEHIRDKRERYLAIANRAVAAMEQWAEETR